MKNVHKIEFHNGSKEELLPDMSPDFPYITSKAELDKFIGRFVPWHWHNAVELFYMESGALEYYTPKGMTVFPAGFGGMVNSNVLHMTKVKQGAENTIQLHHIFEPSFLAGRQGGRIEKKYILPLITAPQIEIIALNPDFPEQKNILNKIRKAFELSESEFGYEIKLRQELSEIWVELLITVSPLLNEKNAYDRRNDKIKLMMAYVHENYANKISIEELAAAAFISERECYRTFQDYLHITPLEYIKSYRLQMACQMLAKGQEPVTFISHACGLGSSSYFGKVFREAVGCTPIEYRRRWQDNDS